MATHLGRLSGPLAIDCLKSLNQRSAQSDHRIEIAGRVWGDSIQLSGTIEERARWQRDEIAALGHHPETRHTAVPLWLDDDPTIDGWHKLTETRVAGERDQSGWIVWDAALDEVGNRSLAQQITTVVPTGVRENFRPQRDPNGLYCLLFGSDIECRQPSWRGSMVAIPPEAHTATGSTDVLGITDEWTRQSPAGPVRCFGGWPTGDHTHLRWWCPPQSAYGAAAEIWTGGPREPWEIDRSQGGHLRVAHHIPEADHSRPWEIYNGIVGIQRSNGSTYRVRWYNGSNWSTVRTIRILVDGQPLPDARTLTIERNDLDGHAVVLRETFDHRPSGATRYPVELHWSLYRGQRGPGLLVVTPAATLRAVETPGDATAAYASSTLFSAVDTSAAPKHLITTTTQSTHTGQGWRHTASRSWWSIQMSLSGAARETPQDLENEWISSLLAQSRTFRT